MLRRSQNWSHEIFGRCPAAKVIGSFPQRTVFDAIHTLELPNKNLTKDVEINRISIAEHRIVISKDSDFYDTFHAKQEPYKLLYLTTGNISNADLLQIFDKNLLLIVHSFQNSSVVELTDANVITVI